MKIRNGWYLAPALCLLLFSGTAAAAPKTETGVINGAEYRIDIPGNWNGGLVVYCHGYAATPGRFEKDKPLPPTQAVFTEAGYALAQSGYSAGGWAVEEAVFDTEALRHHFTEVYGKPKETYITGHSMGGFLTMTLVEKFPSAYDAGLPLCGPLAAPEWFMARGAFDQRQIAQQQRLLVLRVAGRCAVGLRAIHRDVVGQSHHYCNTTLVNSTLSSACL